MTAAELIAEVKKRGVTGAALEDIGRKAEAILRNKASLGGPLLDHAYGIYLEKLANPSSIRDAVRTVKVMRPQMAELYAEELAQRPLSLSKDDAIDMMFAFNNLLTSAAFQGPFGIFGSTDEANMLEAIGFAAAAKFAPNLRISVDVGEDDFANVLRCDGEPFRLPFSLNVKRWPAPELLETAPGDVKHLVLATIWSQLSVLLVAIAKSAGLPGLINPRGAKLPVDSPEDPAHLAALCRAYDDCRARVVALLGEQALTPHFEKM